MDVSSVPLVKFSESLWKTRSEANWSDEFTYKITQAAKLGFFYLEIPTDCKKLIPEMVEFANNFYQNSEIRKITKKSNHSAFVDRKDNQCESLYLDKNDWNPDFHISENFIIMANKMNQICIDVLRTLYRHIAIDEKDFDLVSGGAASDKGRSNFGFNHYRPERTQEGLTEHKDHGHIALLFNNKLGLQFNVDNKWMDETPIQNHFVVIIGKTLEFLIEDRSILKAPIHRVIQCTEDRISFFAQITNHLESPVYKKEGSEFKRFHESYRNYIDEVRQTKKFTD